MKEFYGKHKNKKNRDITEILGIPKEEVCKDVMDSSDKASIGVIESTDSDSSSSTSSSASDSEDSSDKGESSNLKMKKKIRF